MPDEPRKSISNYPGNSHKARTPETQPEKRVERVTTGEVIQKKKSLGRKFAETFTGDDIHSVWSYILMDVMVPAAKSMISDAASQGVERMLFGDSRPRPSSSRSNGFTSYNRFYGSSVTNAKDEPRSISNRARATHDFGEVILASRGEAEDVLDKLQLLIDTYNTATVADLYELVGITGGFTDENYGWTNLRTASPRRVRDGYLLDLPRPEPLN